MLMKQSVMTLYIDNSRGCMYFVHLLSTHLVIQFEGQPVIKL